MMPSFDQDN